MITPHDFETLLVSSSEISDLKREASTLKSWDLSPNDLPLVELLLSGYCVPLHGFMGRGDYDAVLSTMRLATGQPWPVPVTLPVDKKFADSLQLGERIALRDESGVLLAVLSVGEMWSPDIEAEARALFGNVSLTTAISKERILLGGAVEGVELPTHYDFAPLRLTPQELKAQFGKHGWQNILAFQPEGLLHRGEVERVVHAARQTNTSVLVQAPVQPNQGSSAADYTRLRCYEHALRYLPEQSAILAILPVPRSFNPVREIVWRAKLAMSAGASHLLLDAELQRRCDAANWRLVSELSKEIGVELIHLPEFRFDSDIRVFLPTDTLGGENKVVITPPELARRLREGLAIPDWFSYPEVLDELRRSYPPKSRQGVTVFFTGLSGAGKSTIAQVLLAKLLELGERTVTLLDGDIVRKNLSSELGFSREHRDLNILRIGFVASEITKHGGIAICAPIAPYRATRREVRQIISAYGEFIEVHVATPLDTCEARDRKGLYAKARTGLLKEFTGISDPYETPENAEIVIDTRDCTPLEAAQRIITHLTNQGYIR